MTKKQAIQTICDIYDSKVLTPLFGKGEVRQKLKQELERTLDSVIALDSSSVADRNTNLVNLNQFIDFSDMYEKAGSKLAHTLARTEIKTYQDILECHKKTIFGESGLLKLGGIGRGLYRKLAHYLSEKGIILE